MIERFNELPSKPIDDIMIANAQWPDYLRENPGAINTTVGVLTDPEWNSPWQPEVVRRSRINALYQAFETGAFGYQKQQGYADWIAKSGELVFGQKTYLDYQEDIHGIQALGGTGALNLSKYMIETLIKKNTDGEIPLVLDAGWPNHPAIFSEPFNISQYEHMDSVDGRYNHDAAVEAFSEAPENSVFLLQTCGYNDDGLGRTPEQWDEILNLAKFKYATVILDSAYMGLAKGLEQDRYPIKESLQREILTFVAFSASKNMGLYNSKVGSLFIANANRNINDAEQVKRLTEHTDGEIRETYSNPPFVGAKAGALVLEQSEYFDELDLARTRLISTRKLFGEIVKEERPAVAEGSGLFTKIFPNGFTPEQRQSLLDSGIYTLPNSRINLGGLHEDQVERVGEAVLKAIKMP